MAQATYINLEEEPERKVAIEFCPICYLSKPLVITIEDCGHIFCHECLNSYLISRISESKVINIPCPSSHCPTIITRDSIANIMTNEWLQKYDRFLLREELVQNPYVRFCPKIGCDGYDLGGSNKKKLKCNQCSYEYCFFCSEPWHGWKRCKKTVDIEFEQWVDKNNVKFCPKCKRRVEKLGGCPNMSCICGHMWCWRCGGNSQESSHNIRCWIGKDIWNIHWILIFTLILAPLLFPWAPFFLFYVILNWFQEIEPGQWFARHKYLAYALFLIFSPIIEIALLFGFSYKLLYKVFKLKRSLISHALLYWMLLPFTSLIVLFFIPVIAIVIILGAITGILFFFIKVFGILIRRTKHDSNYYPKVFN